VGAVCKAQVAVGAGSKMAPRNRASAHNGVSQHPLYTTAADSYQIAIPDRWSLSELSGAI
jgi:hypothetical protein